MTSSDTLSKCFKGENILKESKKWLKEYNNILQRSFKKIRIIKPRLKSEVVSLMREKAQLKKNIEILKECLALTLCHPGFWILVITFFGLFYAP